MIPRGDAATATNSSRGGLRARWVVPAILIGMLVSGCVDRSDDGSGESDDRDRGDASETAADEAVRAERDYLDAALDVLRDNYHGADRIDWQEMQRVADARLATTPTRSGSYIAISAVLGRIGDSHNGFSPPASASEPPVQAGSLPEVTRSGDRSITIVLPAVSTTDDTHDAYAAATHAAIDAAHDDVVCGWIVDLRGNGGGSMYPMLAAVAPLLAGQQVMSFVDLEGTEHSRIAFDAKGRLLIDGSPAREAPSWRGEEGDDTIAAAVAALGDVATVGRDDPVAVLTDGRTASAAEAVAVAFEGRDDTRRFGGATWGLPTSPRSFDLEDGAVLRVAVSRMTDRTGTAHHGPLRPDVATSEPAEEAAAWLRGTEACGGS